jgi:hypothetical protein
MTTPTRAELAELERAARAHDPDALSAVYDAINTRLGIPPGVGPAWAMDLIADGAAMGAARRAGEEYFAAMPLVADTMRSATDRYYQA